MRLQLSASNSQSPQAQRSLPAPRRLRRGAQHHSNSRARRAKSISIDEAIHGHQTPLVYSSEKGRTLPAEVANQLIIARRRPPFGCLWANALLSHCTHLSFPSVSLSVVISSVSNRHRRAIGLKCVVSARSCGARSSQPESTCESPIRVCSAPAMLRQQLPVPYL